MRLLAKVVIVSSDRRYEMWLARIQKLKSHVASRPRSGCRDMVYVDHQSDMGLAIRCASDISVKCEPAYIDTVEITGKCRVYTLKSMFSKGIGSEL
jgi:hypothetical protein